MFCPECGSKLEDDAVFCPSCGCKIAEADAESVRDETQVSAEKPVEEEVDVVLPPEGPLKEVFHASYEQGVPRSDTPPYTPTNHSNGSGKKTGIIVGIIVGVVLILACAGFGIYSVVRDQAQKKAEAAIAEAQQEMLDEAEDVFEDDSYDDDYEDDDWNDDYETDDWHDDDDSYTTNQGSTSGKSNSTGSRDTAKSNSSNADSSDTNSSTGKTNDDYILPNSSTSRLSSSDISNLTKEQVRLAINEIYARHGRKFESQDLQNYFNSKNWYQGTIEPANFTDNMLSDVERANIDLLSERRNQLGN